MDKNKYKRVKSALTSVWYYKREMQKYDEIIAVTISSVSKITPSYSLTPKSGGNPLDDKMANYVAELEELTSKRSEMAKSYLNKVIYVNELIERLEDPRHIAILRRRYLNCQKWESIADELCYTTRRVTQLHFEAITKLTELI